MSDIPWTHSTDRFDKMWLDEVEKSPNGASPDYIPDVLETMFSQQREQMADYREMYADGTPGGNPVPHEDLWGDLWSPATQASLRENAGYVVEELYEAINLLKNKPWKQTHKEVNIADFMEEVADVWHFFIQFHIVAGLSVTDVFEQYFSKALENGKRRAEGY